MSHPYRTIADMPIEPEVEKKDPMRIIGDYFTWIRFWLLVYVTAFCCYCPSRVATFFLGVVLSNVWVIVLFAKKGL
jgi:hypothetical protein